MSVITACYYTAALKMMLWQYPGFVAELCCWFEKILVWDAAACVFCAWHRHQVPWEAAATQGFLFGLKQLQLKHHFLIRPRSNGGWAASWWQALLRISALQLGCFCIFPFALPAKMYLIYPIYPLSFCGFTNTSCAQSTFSLQLRLLEQLVYNSDTR